MFLKLALQRIVVLRALKIAGLVGMLLIAINHGDALLGGDVDQTRLIKMALTFLVPFCVSVYASVSTMRQLEKTTGNTGINRNRK